MASIDRRENVLKLSNKGLLIIAIILSFITTGLVYSYLKKTSNSQPKDTVSVVVAKVDIGPKTRITPEMVQVVMVPAPYLQPGVVHDPKEVIGAMSKEQIVVGEQVTARRIVVEGKSAGFTGLIPADKRAVTIGVNEVTGVAGFVKAGDFVDVIVTFDQNIVGDNVSQFVLQNVMVLAANREAEPGAVEQTSSNAKDKKELAKTSTVTLAVSPEEASKVTLSEEKGKVRLALRSFMQNADVSIAGSVTPKDIVGIHSSPVPDKQSGEPAPAPPAPPAAKQPVSGIQMIRGTKTEIVPIN